MKTSHILPLVGCVLACASVAVVPSYGAIIIPNVTDPFTLRSGNVTAEYGQHDSEVHVAIGALTQGLTVIDNSDFTAAKNGTTAYRIQSFANWYSGGCYKPQLTNDSLAQWINAGTTAHPGEDNPSGLFAITFNMPSAVSDVVLDIRYLVDNTLGVIDTHGTTLTEGFYLNGQALAGSAVAGLNNFDPVIQPELQTNDRHYVTTVNLLAGENTLYINQTNTGNQSGLIFSALFTPSPTQEPTPEPATLGLLGMGALGLLMRRKKA